MLQVIAGVLLPLTSTPGVSAHAVVANRAGDASGWGSDRSGLPSWIQAASKDRTCSDRKCDGGMWPSRLSCFFFST